MGVLGLARLDAAVVAMLFFFKPDRKRPPEKTRAETLGTH